MMVFQIQMTKRQDVVPITRDYVAREEQSCAGSSAAIGFLFVAIFHRRCRA